MLIQSEEERGKKSKFYSLRPKNVLLLGDTPKDQCKCQNHENMFMKLEAMGKQYESSFWEEILCDTSENSICWLNKCNACYNAKKFLPMLGLAATTTYKQWGNVYVKKQEKNCEDKDEFYIKLSIITKEVAVGQVLDEFQETFQHTVSHFNVKRIQQREFLNDLQSPKNRITQIDFAQAYQCELQKETMGALWSRGSVNLFTCAVYHKGEMKLMLYSTNYKGKDKFAIGVFLYDIYSEELVMDSDIETEIIWSDGPSSEFKNQFMRQLIEDFSLQYGKKLIWKFSATSHGKGVVDGIGGNVKSNVRRQVMSMKKD